MSQPWQIDIIKEVTGTVDGFRYPENVYYVTQNGTKLVAFYPEGDKDAFVVYNKPMKFDKRGRKFETIAKGLNSL